MTIRLSSLVEESQRCTPFPADLCCPNCRGRLVWTDAKGHCSACGGRAVSLAEHLVDFLGGDSADADDILSWSEETLEEVVSHLSAVGDGKPLPAPAWDDLRAKGLADGNARLTARGDNMSYHLQERLWQSGNEEFTAFLDCSQLGPDARVLDVGCGAGQTLQLLASRSPALRVGIDIDRDMLALGQRLARQSNQAIGFGRASIHNLPFPDGHFSHLICRNMLSYVHQRRGLQEMIRVLRPGGFLFLRVERLWHDVSGLLHPESARQFVCRVRDFGYGLIHALVGWQPTPGRRLTGGRAFGTAWHLTRWLRRLDCQVLSIQPSIRAQRCLGMRTQLTLTAQRQG